MEKKKCGRCHNIKSIDEFCKDKSRPNGRMYVCRSCESIRNFKRSRTEHGLLSKIYNAQKRTSKKRGHNPPVYTFEELKHWCFSKPNWKELYENWVKSEYNIDLRPSIDRLEDDKGYYFGNIQLVTWRENLIKATDDQKNGRMIISHRKVIQLSMNGDFIEEFFSIAEAGRVTGFDDSSIVKACKGKLKTVRGFKWKYKHP